MTELNSKEAIEIAADVLIGGEKLAEDVKLKDGKTKVNFSSRITIDGVDVFVEVKISKNEVLPLFLEDEKVEGRINDELESGFLKLKEIAKRYMLKM